jgi:hypothetical protein
MHKVNTIYKRETIAFTKDNIHFHSISLESKHYISRPMRTTVMKKRKWHCSLTILSRSRTPKIWVTLPAFYPLLIQLYLPNDLDVTEF